MALTVIEGIYKIYPFRTERIHRFSYADGHNKTPRDEYSMMIRFQSNLTRLIFMLMILLSIGVNAAQVLELYNKTSEWYV